jgi:hypothetical protein
MMTRPLLAATLALLSMLTACGGGGAQAEEQTAQARVRTASVDSSSVTTPAIGGIGGSGVATPQIGGIGGSGVVAESVRNGVSKPAIGGIGGSGVATSAIGGIGGSGIAAVSLATACGVTGVDVTIASVRLNQSATADAAGDGWFDVALAAPLHANLLALSSGAALPFDLSALPDGTYSQVRLLLVGNDPTTPLADSLASPAGAESALAVPSAAQGGLRLVATIAVSGGRASGSWTASAVCQALGLGTVATS